MSIKTYPCLPSGAPMRTQVYTYIVPYTAGRVRGLHAQLYRQTPFGLRKSPAAAEAVASRGPGGPWLYPGVHPTETAQATNSTHCKPNILKPAIYSAGNRRLQ